MNTKWCIVPGSIVSFKKYCDDRPDTLIGCVNYVDMGTAGIKAEDGAFYIRYLDDLELVDEEKCRAIIKKM